jgi:tetratricopeptide (TPR) repeat protein
VYLAIAVVSILLFQADPPVGVEVGHANWDCDSLRKGLTCNDDGHYLIWFNGKELKDLSAFEARLKELSPGKSSIDRKILLRPSLKTPFERVWPVLAACRNANCTRLAWWDDPPAVDELKARENAPLDVLIRIDRERLRGTEIRFEDGAWTKNDADLLAALEKSGAGPETRVIVDPGGDVPWADLSHLEELCRRRGLERIEYLGIPSPPGRSRAVSPEEAVKVAEFLDNASREDQPALFDRLLDRHELHARLTGSYALSNRIRHLVAEMFEMVAPSGKMLRKGPEGQKALKYLRMNGARPLFRYLTAAGVDYLELVLEKDGRGKVRIVDLASWSMNSMATEAYRAIALSSNDKISLLNKLRAPTPMDVAHPESRELGELLGLVSEGKHVEAMQLFTSKVDALKKSEYALRLYLNASRQAGADAFVGAVKEYEKHFPKSTTLLFMRMESYLAKKDLEKALEAIDALDRLVDGDPYLDLLRARAHSGSDDPKSAVDACEKAVLREPTLAVGWWSLIAYALQQKDYAKVASTLTELEQNLKLPMESVETAPAFADFVKSEEYRRWAAARKK